MTLPQQIDVDELVGTYMVSNTPAYLYKHYRRSESVAWMAGNLSVEQLVALLREAREKLIKSPADMALAYAAVVALSLKDYELVREIIEGLDTTGLEWGKDIKINVISHAKPTTLTVIKPGTSRKSFAEPKGGSCTSSMHFAQAPRTKEEDI